MKTRRNFWSLIELTIILVVLSILCAILAPVIDRYVRNAKVIRCREDVQALGMAITMFIEDTANSYFMMDGSPWPKGGAGYSRPDQSEPNRVDMLVSDGDIPEVGPDGADDWAASANFCTVDFLAYHLVTNTPGGNPDDTAYRTPSDLVNPHSDPMFARTESGGFNSEFAWRGPYITAPVDPDPWGNRYAVNVIYLDPQADTAGGTSVENGFAEDVVVLSAGPDEEIDTLFAVDGLTPGDDDILYTVSGNSRP